MKCERKLEPKQSSVLSCGYFTAGERVKVRRIRRNLGKSPLTVVNSLEMYEAKHFQSSFRLVDQIESVMNPETFRRYVKCRIAWILKIIAEFCLGKLI